MDFGLILKKCLQVSMNIFSVKSNLKQSFKKRYRGLKKVNFTSSKSGKFKINIKYIITTTISDWMLVKSFLQIVL